MAAALAPETVAASVRVKAPDTAPVAAAAPNSRAACLECHSDEKAKMKKAGGTKFDETVNLVVHLGIDAKQADQSVRGAVSLPKGIGKTNRVIAFVQGGNIDVAKAAGAGRLIYERKLVFGRGGRLAYAVKVYPAVKQTFDAIHGQDERTLTLRQQGAGAVAGQ